MAFTSNNCSAPMDIIWTEFSGAGPGGLLRNLDGAGFEDVTWTAGVANLNNDGYPDLVYANRTDNTSENSAAGSS